MGKLNIAQFASELGLPVALLLEQLNAAGVAKRQESDPMSEKDKAKLLEHLRQTHGAEKSAKKITLIRRETTEIKKADSSGRARTIQLEVRKRRVMAASPETEATTSVTVPSRCQDAKVCCDVCLAMVHKDRISRHLKRVHNIVMKQPTPVGRVIISELAKGKQCRANKTEVCDTCRRRITYLDVGRRRQKAFDVDKKKNILGTHICNGPVDQSLHAYSGGIIDSNRRKH